MNHSHLRTAAAALALLVQAGLFTAPAGAGEITFEQVLSRPDDPDLNYRYALARIEAGDLLPALSALERVIAAAPARHEARLVRALVLFRLESLAEASRELDGLERLPLSPELRARIRELQAQIALRQSRFTVGARLGAGFENNSNRKATPSSGQMSLSGRLIDLTGISGKADNNILAFAGLDFRQDLGSPQGHDISESLTYYRTHQAEVTTLDLDAVSARISGRYRSGATDAVLILSYDDVRLARERYLSSPGAGLRLERRFKRTAVYAEGSYAYQKFVKNPVSSGAPDRAGGLAEISAGWDYQLSASMKLGLEYGLALKKADEGIYDFRRRSLALKHAWFPGGGAFLETSVEGGLALYPEANVFVSGRHRKDSIVRAGTTLGLPLDRAWRALKGLMLTASGEVQDYRSTITNYTYRNYKAGLTLSYRWQSGL